MHSLFLKIFLWFWFAMVLVVLTLLISSSYSESRNTRERDEAMDRTMSPLVADNFAEVFDREGPPGFSALLARGKDAFPWMPYLFDPSGAEALGRSVSPKALEAFRLALASRGTEVVHSGEARWVGQWVQVASGKPYVVVLEVNRRPPNPFLRAPLRSSFCAFSPPFSSSARFLSGSRATLPPRFSSYGKRQTNSLKAISRLVSVRFLFNAPMNSATLARTSTTWPTNSNASSPRASV